MVTLKNKPRTLETPVNPKQATTHEPSQPLTSGYEQCRDKRIRENMERMQKLGIFDLSSKLKSAALSPKRSPKRGTCERRTPRPSPLQSSEPRRSSRLQDSAPVSYSELDERTRVKRERCVRRKRREGPLVGQGPRPEIYTEEHEKLLGSCEGSWTLFVDGCGVDGRRVYDSIQGKTCHQCRQKTLGHRTQCSSCVGVQGQFCGDCLYMRYGEHVLEANQNPNWTCPVCRDICNCSLCRSAKGWPATGALYRTIKDLGFKSVAHYLIQTKRAETKSDDVGTEDPVTVKKSLPFTEEVAEQNDTLNSPDRQYRSSKDKKGDELGENKELPSAVTEQISLDTEEVSEMQNLDAAHDGEKVKDDEPKGDKKEFMNESASKVTQAGISSKLRSRHNKLDQHAIVETPTKETKSDGSEAEKEEQSLNESANKVTQAGIAIVETPTKETKSDGSEAEKEEQSLNESANKVTQAGIASRLRSRRNKLDQDSTVQTPSNKETKAEKEEASLSEQGAVAKVASGRKRKSYEPNPDSISGRLRQRSNRSKI